MRNYDEMSDKYKSTNKVRTVTMFISGISFIIIAIFDVIMKAIGSGSVFQTMGG